jgi:ectoine hydroxylase-related dioxygenase (phytanoyl-CoA dioxygenase family)
MNACMTTIATPTSLDLDSPYPLTAAQIAHYREHGYVKLKHVLSAEVLAHYGPEITRLVKELNTQDVPLDQRSTYDKAFLQIQNLWAHSEVVREFVFSQRLARIAAGLMDVSGVRLYHDQALYKEPGGGVTPWHADQFYWPVSSDAVVTAWIPLLALPREMGPLAFSPGTHRMSFGRDLAISDESEKKLGDVLRDNPLDDTPFDLGEVSFHSGWLFHRAGANTSNKPREVMTIIYMDEDMRLLELKTKHHRNDHARWCPEAREGEIIDTPLNPVLWSSRG